ncbi:MAG: VWA domain-containing protein [Thermoanaerobaculia bacterium]
MIRRLRALAGLALALASASAPADSAAAPVARAASPALSVAVVRPAPGDPVFGTIEIALDVRGAATRVELTLDGKPLGQLTKPPWSITADVGEENVERRLHVVATGPGGERAETDTVLGAFRIDEQIDIELQQLYVTATRSGEPALDLDRGAFRVTDDGDLQEIVTFERGDVPITAVLLVDCSRSMRGEPLAAALAGVRAFAAGMAPLDEAMLLAASDRVVASTPFTADPAVLTGGLTGEGARGGTAINDHLFLALLELERRQGRRVVILLSDGVDVDSLLSARELEPVVGASPAMLFWIRLSGDLGSLQQRSEWRDVSEHQAELAALAHLVERGGGRILDVPTVDGVAGAFRDILAELRSQYVLGYYPTRSRHDGSWHELKVEVSASGVRLRTREGYRDE